jgi:ferredoxin/flavodoxin
LKEESAMPINQALVVYFSGTGGTARAADAMEAALVSRGVNVNKQEIHHNNVFTNGDEDLLVLLYAVHALNAPEPVYRWLESLTPVPGISAAVLAVSGGGEVFPNKACRVSSIKRLKNKGYDVTYEDMLVMPSNMSASTPDNLAVRLLEVLPQKVQTIADDLLSGVTRHTKPGPINRFMSVLGEGEKYGAHWFGKVLHANENCTSCGWCARQCPSGNITMAEKTPEFDGKCVMCFRCVYGCPTRAIKAKHMGFVLNKQGFDMKRYDVMEETEDVTVKGVAWKGVNKYLGGDGKSVTSDDNRTVPRG